MNRLSELKENRKLDNKGFSLVELIIVIAIMAVLIGVLAPQYLKYVEKSRRSADLDSWETIISTIEIFASDPDNAAKVTGTAKVDFTSKGTNGVVTGWAVDATADANIDVTKISMKSNAFGKSSVDITIDSAGNVKFTFANGLSSDPLDVALGRKN